MSGSARTTTDESATASATASVTTTIRKWRERSEMVDQPRDVDEERDDDADHWLSKSSGLPLFNQDRIGEALEHIGIGLDVEHCEGTVHHLAIVGLARHEIGRREEVQQEVDDRAAVRDGKNR